MTPNTMWMAAATLSFLCPTAQATLQSPDTLELDGTVSSLLSSPMHRELMKYFPNGGTEDIPCTSSHRTYLGHWQVKNKQLLLVKVNLHPCRGTGQVMDLRKISKGAKGSIKADWFTGVLYVGRGKPTGITHMIRGYERYVALVVERGKVLSRTELDEAPTW